MSGIWMEASKQSGTALFSVSVAKATGALFLLNLENRSSANR
nr:hypothetical protein [Paenibacillus segetis]